jgi:hypothetical protein
VEWEGGEAVSDTPRTDEFDGEYSEWSPAKPQNWPKFSRQLERELNAANELIVRLQAVTNDPHALWANWLRGSVALPVGIGDVREYQERIKRLEEGGGLALGYASQGDFHSADEVWLKAKEVKQ